MNESKTFNFFHDDYFKIFNAKKSYFKSINEKKLIVVFNFKQKKNFSNNKQKKSTIYNILFRIIRFSIFENWKKLIDEILNYFNRVFNE